MHPTLTTMVSEEHRKDLLAMAGRTPVGARGAGRRRGALGMAMRMVRRPRIGLGRPAPVGLQRV